MIALLCEFCGFRGASHHLLLSDCTDNYPFQVQLDQITHLLLICNFENPLFLVCLKNIVLKKGLVGIIIWKLRLQIISIFSGLQIQSFSLFEDWNAFVEFLKSKNSGAKSSCLRRGWIQVWSGDPQVSLSYSVFSHTILNRVRVRHTSDATLTYTPCVWVWLCTIVSETSH